MPSDSGRFEYGYDALNQLISVTKDGKLQREYTYDTFGNRSSKKSYDVADKMIETVYKYNNKNQLLVETTGDVTKNYTYDLRGNIKTVTTGQDLIRNFTYDARNMLSEVSEQLNGITQKANYNYNGLGKRMAQRVNTPSDPEKVIRYTLDLTRDYHNMLTLSTESEVQSKSDNYFYDFNVVGMSRAVGDDYFIQDDLGSPMSVINQRGDIEEAYAYDEFGQEYGNIIDARNRFQPLSYTGYQKEAVGDTYFAQARRYDASLGRFVSEDRIKGSQIIPISMNQYVYCLNRPQDLLDIDENSPRAGITKICEGYLGSTIKWDSACPFEETWNKIKHDATNVFNHVKSGASKAWDSFKDWAQSDTGKVVLTTAAIVGVAAVGVFVGGPAGIGLLCMALSAETGAVSGGISNAMAGNSMANGYVGGAVNGAISSSSVFVGGKANVVAGFVTNGFGGYMGNEVTARLDRADGYNNKNRCRNQ